MEVTHQTQNTKPMTWKFLDSHRHWVTGCADFHGIRFGWRHFAGHFEMYKCRLQVLPIIVYLTNPCKKKRLLPELKLEKSLWKSCLHVWRLGRGCHALPLSMWLAWLLSMNSQLFNKERPHNYRHLSEGMFHKQIWSIQHFLNWFLHPSNSQLHEILAILSVAFKPKRQEWSFSVLVIGWCFCCVNLCQDLFKHI